MSKVISLDLLDLENKISKYKIKEKELEKKVKLLGILPLKKEIDSIIKQKTDNTKQLENDLLPVESTLKNLGNSIVYNLLKSLNKSEKIIIEVQFDLEEKIKRIEEISKFIVEKKIDRERILVQIQEWENRIQEIDRKQKLLEQIWREEEISIEDKLKELNLNISDLKKKIDDNLKNRQEKEIILKNESGNLQKLEKEIFEIETNFKIKKAEIDNFTRKFNELLTNLYYIENFGQFEISYPLNYSYLENKKLDHLKNNFHEFQDKFFEFSLSNKELNAKKDYFENKNEFPFNQNAEKIKEFLNENGIQSFIGWEYIKKIKNTVEERKLIIEANPILLESIIILEKKEKFPILVNLLETSRKNLEDIMEPVQIFSIEALENNISDDSCRSIFVPNLDWRYNSDKANDFYQKIQGLYEKNKEKIENYSNKIKSLNSYLLRWEEFQTAYGEEEYIELLNSINQLEVNLKSKEGSLDDQHLLINSLNNEILTLKKEEKSLNESFFHIDRQKFQLDNFLPEYKKKFDLLIKKEQNDGEFATIDDEIFRYVNENENLEKKIVLKKEELRRNQGIFNNLDNQINDIKQKVDINEKDLIQVQNFDSRDINTLKSEFNIEYLKKEELINKSQVALLINYLENQLNEKQVILSNDLKNNQFLMTDLDSIEKEYIGKNLEEVKILRAEFEDEKNNFSLLVVEEKNSFKSKTKDKSNLDKEIALFGSEIQKKITILEVNRDKLLELKSENEDTKKNLESQKSLIETSLKNLEEDNNGMSNKLNNLLQTSKLIETALITSVSWIENKKSSEIFLEQLNITIEELLDSANEKFTVQNEVATQFNKIGQEITAFIQKIHRLELYIDDLMKNRQYTQFIKGFNKDHIISLEEKVNSFEARLETIKLEILGPKKRLSVIVKRYTDILSDIIYRLRQLNSIKLTIPEIDYLNGKQVINIQINEESDEDLETAINSFFSRFFGQESIDSIKNLSQNQLIFDIVDSYLKNNLKKIFILYPDKESISYIKVNEVHKISGGEKLTIGILLFCLIAYYRLKYVMGLGIDTEPFPLFMDNPIGTANRLDFIKMQVNIAEKLGIQLVPFTGIKDFGLLDISHHFPCLISLKMDKKVGSYNLIEVDEKNSILSQQTLVNSTIYGKDSVFQVSKK